LNPQTEYKFIQNYKIHQFRTWKCSKVCEGKAI